KQEKNQQKEPCPTIDEMPIHSLDKTGDVSGHSVMSADVCQHDNGVCARTIGEDGYKQENGKKTDTATPTTIKQARAETSKRQGRKKIPQTTASFGNLPNPGRNCDQSSFLQDWNARHLQCLYNKRGRKILQRRSQAVPERNGEKQVQQREKKYSSNARSQYRPSQYLQNQYKGNVLYERDIGDISHQPSKRDGTQYRYSP